MTVRERISTIPELACIDIHRVVPLDRGLTNTSHLLETDQGRWVLRLNRTTAGIDREREALVLGAIAKHELAPKVIACEPVAGYLITEFLELDEWSIQSASDERKLQCLAMYLRRLHGLNTNAPAVDVVLTLGHYIAAIENTEPELAAHLSLCKKALVQSLQGVGFFERAPALCHLDLTVTNIFGTATMRLIDWEFSGTSHPLLDLAFFIHYHDLTPDTYAPLIEGYYGAWIPEIKEQLGVQLELCQLLECAWLLLQRQQGRLAKDGQRRLKRLMVVLG